MNLDRLRAVAIALLAAAGVSAQTSPPPIARFIDAASPDSKLAKAALEEIAASWTDAYVPMFVDMVRLMRPSARSPAAQEDTASLDADEGDVGAVRAPRKICGGRSRPVRLRTGPPRGQ